VSEARAVSLPTQIGELAFRSVKRTARQPATIFPSLIFPLFLMAVNTGGLDTATNIPGFPTDSYLTFALAVPFIQGGLFATMNIGADLARDIETGFLNRLSLTPMSGTGLLVGQLAGVIALGLFQAVIYLAVGLAVGADFEAGLAGIPVLLALSVAIIISFGTVGTFMALRLGSGEAVQGMFPVFFVFLFFSSMALPRDLIQTGWFQTIATWNPVSYMIEAVRSLFIEGIDAETLALGFGVAVIIATVFLAASVSALRTRMGRT
jgi:ABC-2 type transport system permease protein